MARSAAWDNPLYTPDMASPLSHSEILAALPEEGLFRASQPDRLPWLASPQPLVLTKKEVRALTSLGHILGKFYDLCDELYQSSAKGKSLPWLAPLLDKGKPEWLIAQQRSPELRGITPQVIRPDLLLTEDGFSLTELDSVPGGMGVTHWLSILYAHKGWDVLGGGAGMAEGFRRILPSGADILVSQESGDYRPEMNYFAGILGDDYALREAEHYVPTERAVYRFFELFDLPNIPGARELIESMSNSASLTPPPKPHFEEKLWLALFHLPGLRTVWKTRLRENHFARLESLIPQGWIMDPTPLPPQAALPWLNLNSWKEVGDLSQKERQLVAKISGFDETAWGARGVYIGHDLSSEEWKKTLKLALDSFDRSPWIMQKFINGRQITHPYYDPETAELKQMSGRVRLCPYFFRTTEGETLFGGCLATIAPADKKKIHGMKDAVLVPCVQE